MAKPKLTVILGPTASGKTDYSLHIAKRLSAVIVSADSRQVYKGMNIGTGKVKDTKGILHYLLDVRNPDQPMTLPEWQKEAFDAIDKILSQNRQPILVGGTMLYTDSIVRNYRIPHVAPDAEFRKLKVQNPNFKLYEELMQKDPEAKKFIEPGNTRRIIRALEVIEATGKSFSEQRKRREAKYAVEMIGLFPGWDELKKRIELRAIKMFQAGLLDELKTLREKFGKDLPLLQTQNYRQARAVLDQETSREEVIADMVKSDMRYARRQMSWWRDRKEIHWINPRSFFAEA